MAGILEGKRILVTGIITDSSIGFHIAQGRAGGRTPNWCSPASTGCG